MGSLFKSKNQGVSVLADPYGETRTKLLDWLNTQIGQPAQQYSGEYVAPKSAEEAKSLDYLNQYASGGPSELTTASKKQYLDTLSGNYDPSSSPYYQAVKAESARNLAETNKNIASDAAGGGRYWSGARLQQQREAGTDVANSLNTVLGGLAENERQRMLTAAAQAAEFGKSEEESPLRKASALQEYGSIDRVLQQAYDDAVREEWLRATQQYPLDIASLAAQVQQAPLYGKESGSSNALTGLLGNLAKTGATKVGDWIGSKIFK